MPERAIIHFNVADFAVAVERVLDSCLQSRPLIVAPAGAARALVYDMSEEAYREGVRKGMPLRLAVKRCREAAVLPPRPEHYRRAMAASLKAVSAFSPLVEESGEGHLFLDATGISRLFGPPRDLAWRLRKKIRSELRLDPGWAVAPNKLLAKVATRVVKPNGEFIVVPGAERTFLAPQPIQLLPGVEPWESERLRELNIVRIGQLAAFSCAQLAVPFGRRAAILHDLARGIDAAPVAPARKAAPTLRFWHRFSGDTNELAQIEAALYGLIEQAGTVLRQRRLAARRLGLRIDYADDRHLVRQATGKHPVQADADLWGLARLALERAWVRRVRVRRLELLCTLLCEPSGQLSLFAAVRKEEQKKQGLGEAIDRIREQFGAEIIQTGRQVSAVGG
jgi:DNA polymerase-4